MANIITRIIPNTLTCGNLVSGCIATVFALSGDARMALLWIIAGAVFDFFDGMSARLLNVSSPIGKELDSLADDVTFGVAPAAIIFRELQTLECPDFLAPVAEYLPYFAFVMAAFSALRLAKFNLDTRQTTSFIGLPTPANALFWGSLLVSRADWFESSPLMVPVLLLMICFSSWLLVAEIPMFALKFKHWGWKENELRYTFIVFSAVMIFFFGIIQSFWMIVAWYFIVSLCSNMMTKKAQA
ncbi:CDP-diacylglycerol--serine O-phosphatidyltransferase [Prevotella sp.]|uniref:CDP-diacylglycerol--serine O-phosphatidyltransferase n=1 Tax=Prevotella sp. TaxID=59823 RepID=UPI0025FF9635|nr:CDP-diacylglycerol--serine O-phosphatidyltransferase [Prevotella sp.]